MLRGNIVPKLTGTIKLCSRFDLWLQHAPAIPLGRRGTPVIHVQVPRVARKFQIHHTQFATDALGERPKNYPF